MIEGLLVGWIAKLATDAAFHAGSFKMNAAEYKG